MWWWFEGSPQLALLGQLWVEGREEGEGGGAEEEAEADQEELEEGEVREGWGGVGEGRGGHSTPRASGEEDQCVADLSL